MADRAPAGAQITFATGGTVLRLKSWLPQPRSGDESLVIGGQAFPAHVGATSSGAMRALCIGPREWLMVSQEGAASNVRKRIEPELAQGGLVWVDVTDGLVALEVRGSAAREILSKGCGLDLHPRSFPAGRCARTRFAQIPVIVECVDQMPRFELYVARSYVDYLHAWLADAAVEFGASLM
jgi:sarcosine oxidase subunit gamma